MRLGKARYEAKARVTRVVGPLARMLVVLFAAAVCLTAPAAAPARVVLMKRLGHARFVAQGGDWGALIVDQMGVQATPELLGNARSYELIQSESNWRANNVRRTPQ